MRFGPRQCGQSPWEIDTLFLTLLLTSSQNNWQKAQAQIERFRRTICSFAKATWSARMNAASGLQASVASSHHAAPTLKPLNSRPGAVRFGADDRPRKIYKTKIEHNSGAG
jgi:hypothetical protein